MKPLLHQRYDVEANYPGPIPEPYCDPKAAPLAVDHLPDGISSIFLLSRTNVTAAESVLAFTTGDHVVTPYVIASTDHGDPGCGGYVETKDVQAEAVAGGVLVSWIIGTQTNAYPGFDGAGTDATDASVRQAGDGAEFDANAFSDPASRAETIASSRLETRALLCKPAGGGVECVGNGKEPAIFGVVDGTEHLTNTLPKYRRVALTIDGSGKIIAR